MPEETVPQDNFDRRLAHLQSNSLAAGLSSPTLTMHRSNFTFYISPRIDSSVYAARIKEGTPHS
jgi:ABC-type amino acid transport substrate-binding protein